MSCHNKLFTCEGGCIDLEKVEEIIWEEDFSCVYVYFISSRYSVFNEDVLDLIVSYYTFNKCDIPDIVQKAISEKVNNDY